MNLTVADYIQILGVIIALLTAAAALFKVSSENEVLKTTTKQQLDDMVTKSLEREEKLRDWISKLEEKINSQSKLIEKLKTENAAKDSELKSLRKLTMDQSEQITDLQNEIKALRLKRK